MISEVRAPQASSAVKRKDWRVPWAKQWTKEKIKNVKVTQLRVILKYYQTMSSGADVAYGRAHDSGDCLPYPGHRHVRQCDQQTSWEEKKERKEKGEDETQCEEEKKNWGTYNQIDTISDIPQPELLPPRGTPGMALSWRTDQFSLLNGVYIVNVPQRQKDEVGFHVKMIDEMFYERPSG
jgi:hypothetical protein